SGPPGGRAGRSPSSRPGAAVAPPARPGSPAARSAAPGSAPWPPRARSPPGTPPPPCPSPPPPRTISPPNRGPALAPGDGAPVLAAALVVDAPFTAVPSLVSGAAARPAPDPPQPASTRQARTSSGSDRRRGGWVGVIGCCLVSGALPLEGWWRRMVRPVASRLKEPTCARAVSDPASPSCGQPTRCRTL